MEFSKDLLANTVSSQNQLPDSQYVTFHYTENAVKNVLFVGNSITLHGSKPSIGWTGHWGMAASAPEKDYVHLTVDGLQECFGPVNWCIAQGAVWERAYNDDSILPTHYAAAREFAADIVFVRIGENTARNLLESADYKEAFAKMVRFFTPKAEKIIVSDLFWASPAIDDPIRAAVSENGWTPVSLGDLGAQDCMKAVGLFEHAGVAGHPGDLGMRTIADRLLAAL